MTENRFHPMRLAFALTALLVAATPVLAQAQQRTLCTYGQQPCPNARPVPFPVINLGSGLNTVLTYPLRNNLPPSPPPPPPSAHIATPPPVLPPGY